MDGADISDPEMGGATFSNFNVDAVEGIDSSSGWMPAEVGRGAAGFTNIHTRSGASGFHGSVFELCATPPLTRAITLTIPRPPIRGAFHPSGATNSASPTAARSFFRTFMMAANGPSTSCSIKAFARCWGPRR